MSVSNDDENSVRRCFPYSPVSACILGSLSLLMVN
uniref:Uncharacterized protein n=1 Tax=Arundo donax TaxID=35708 RepID=A0A0A9EWY2_ARUDO